MSRIFEKPMGFILFGAFGKVAPHKKHQKMRFDGGFSRKIGENRRKTIHLFQYYTKFPHQTDILQPFLGELIRLYSRSTAADIIEARIQIPQSGIASVASLRQRRRIIEARLQIPQGGIASVASLRQRRPNNRSNA